MEPLLTRVGRDAEAAPEARVAGVDEQLLAGLGVLHDDDAGVGQLDLAGVPQPNRDDLVPLREERERRAPSPVR